MVQKKRQVQSSNFTSLFTATILILLAAFLSSLVQERSYPTFESPSGQVVTGYATGTFTTLSCASGEDVVLKVSSKSNAHSATYDTSNYQTKICFTGSGRTCNGKNAIIRIYDPDGDGKADNSHVETAGPSSGDRTNLITSNAIATGAFSFPTPSFNIPSPSSLLPSHCSDGVWSGDESDQDCGGSCFKCSADLSCWSNSDCSSTNCYFDSSTLALRSSNSISSTYRSTNTADIQYQGVCKSQNYLGTPGYSDVCFGTGPYHYENTAALGIPKGTCKSPNSCIFTISSATNAHIGECSSSGYGISVCTGGSCSGTDCSQPGCNDQVSCDSNSANCAWDEIENGGTCRSKTDFAVCNQFGITLCKPSDFVAGDYSCLYKDPSSGYYTKACVGSGQVGFWHIPEIY